MTASPTAQSSLHGMLPIVEVGLRLAPTGSCSPAAAGEIARCLGASNATTVRIAGVGTEGSRVIVTLGISLGTVDEVRAGDQRARDAVEFIALVVAQLAQFEPAFTALPHRESPDARIADEVQSSVMRQGADSRAASGAREPVTLLQAVTALASLL